MVTLGIDLQPGCLADRLLTGLGQPQVNHAQHSTDLCALSTNGNYSNFLYVCVHVCSSLLCVDGSYAPAYTLNEAQLERAGRASFQLSRPPVASSNLTVANPSSNFCNSKAGARGSSVSSRPQAAPEGK